jgi:adenylate cyclase
MDTADDPGLKQLLDQAAVRAEATIAKLRLVTALVVGATLMLIAVVPALFGNTRVPVGQVVAALVTILGYVGLAFLTIWLTTPARFRPWMSFAFVTGDAVLLALGLTSGFINSGLDAPFAPIFPVVWLAPVLLAFGTLRYDVRVQAFAVVATLGAIVLTALVAAPHHRPADPWEQAQRLLGLPPAIVRIVMLALAGIVLVIAVRRSRDLLLRATGEAQARANLTRFLPRQVVDALAGGGAALRRGRRQHAAVLFIDIRGFTRRAEALPPEEIGPFLAEFRRRAAVHIESQGGLIEKFLGDGILAVFGVPEPAEGDARRALVAARAVLDEIAAWRVGAPGTEATVAVGIGAHAGPLFAGTIGDGERVEFTVIGDTVNVAARLQELTKEIGTPLLASDAIVRAAGEAEDPRWRPLPAQPLRGRDAPIDLRAWSPA